MDINIHGKVFEKRKLSIIYQSEISECGLACICMISNYFGRETDLLELRELSNFTQKGVNLTGLIGILDKLSLSSRAVRIELEDLKTIDKPCILHWNMTHYVVLKSVNNTGIVVLDPSKGEIDVPWEEVDRRFTGVALEIHPSTNFRPLKKSNTFNARAMLSNIKGLKSGLWHVFLLALTVQVFSLAIPYFTQVIVDSVIPNRELSLLIILALSLSLCLIVKSVVSAFRSWMVIYLRSKLNLELVSDVFKKILRLPLDWFERRHIGDVMSRVFSISQINHLVSTTYIESIVDGLIAITTFLMMCIYSIELAFISLGFLVLFFIIKYSTYSKLIEYTEETIQFSAKESSVFLESLRAIGTIKISNQESNRYGLWKNSYSKWLNSDIKLAKFNLKLDFANNFINSLETVFILSIGSLFIVNMELSLGMLLAFIAYQSMFSSSMQKFINNIFEYRVISLHISRVSEIVKAKDEKYLFTNSTNSTDLDNITLELKNISHRYGENEPYILEDISLVVPFGKSLAIVGKSGAGKTTLLKIAMGLIQPEKGEVLLNGININKIGLKLYRSLISSVLQNDSLLSGTIAQNISSFSSDIEMDNVLKCAYLSDISDDINMMPMKYNTLVGDMGNTLSGGQSQRVIIARALYRNPKLLFLDEATSHLDIKSESTVNTNLDKLALTRLIVAHRIDTIESSDFIFNLDSKKLLSKNQFQEEGNTASVTE